MNDVFPPDTSIPPDPGNAVFYKECPPPLPQGNYTLTLKQDIAESESEFNNDNMVDEGSSRPLPDQRQHRFTIAGPRFTLDPAEIHAAYPPPNSEGPFSLRLPMIVLRRRTLPWERPLDTQGTPWLALLLFEEDEVTLLDPPECSVATILAADTGQGVQGLPSVAATDAERQQKCLGLQVPLSTFRQIAPLKEEVSLLTHVRQVNTEDKELLGMDKDGWFAVVVGNRLPTPGKKHIACLVSLEGHLDHLPEAHEVLTSDDLQEFQPGLPYATIGVYYDFEIKGYVVASPPAAIRMAVLARWEFTCQGEGDFESLMRKIPTRGGVAMMGMSPQDAVLPENLPTTAYNVALESGHVPLSHQTREGESVIAWYRGPLVPAGVERDTTNGPYHTADQARRIDPLTGMENLGYAAAFEIGRLLALSDPNFALDLLRWRRGGHNRVVKAVVDGLLADALVNVIPEFDPRLVLETHELAIPILEDLTGMVKEQILGPLTDPTGLMAFSEQLPGLSAATVAELNQLDAGMVSTLFGPSLEGGSRVLDGLGIQDTLVLESDFDTLIETASDQFGHLDAQRGKLILGKEGFNL